MYSDAKKIMCISQHENELTLTESKLNLYQAKSRDGWSVTNNIKYICKYPSFLQAKNKDWSQSLHNSSTGNTLWFAKQKVQSLQIALDQLNWQY